jgi:hypothetical protein
VNKFLDAWERVAFSVKITITTIGLFSVALAFLRRRLRTWTFRCVRISAGKTKSKERIATKRLPAILEFDMEWYLAKTGGSVNHYGNEKQCCGIRCHHQKADGGSNETRKR